MQKLVKQKVVILGDEQVGKTFILDRFIFDNFDQRYHPTVGVDFITKTIEVMNQSLKLQIWDTAGQIRFRSLIPSYIRDSQAAIVCYDITNEKSFHNIPMWIQMISEERGDEVLIYIIGNKEDLKLSRKVDLNQAKLMALASNAQYFETSAESGNQINNLFLKIATDLIDENFKIQHQNNSKLFQLQYGQNQINTFVD